MAGLQERAKSAGSKSRLVRELSANRLASKFNPDTLYDIKHFKNKSNGSVSILETNQNPIRGLMNSSYLNSYFDMKEDEKSG